MATSDFDTIGDYEFIRVGEAELEKGLVDTQISSINDFYRIGIPQIVTQVFKIEKDVDNNRSSTDEDKEIEKFHVVVNFTHVTLSKPVMSDYKTGHYCVLFPTTALIEDKTYSAPLHVNAKIVATAFLKNGNQVVREDVVENFKLCSIPVMVGSILCNKTDMTREELIRCGEDPDDLNGYFIVRGVEWVINNKESILFNQIQIFKYIGHSRELYDCRFISKPGDSYQNSDQLLIKMNKDGQITCNISRDKLKELNMPFYIIFRALGWETDEEVFNNIVWSYDDEISGLMCETLRTAFRVKYTNLKSAIGVRDQMGVIKCIVDEVKEHFKYCKLGVSPDGYHRASKAILKLFDTNFLQHIGTTEAVRYKKLRYFALIIRKVVLVYLGILQPTERDSYRTKRVHPAGVSYAKSFKTHLNSSVISNVKQTISKVLDSTSFSQIDLSMIIKLGATSEKLEKYMVQAITSGNKTQIKIDSNRSVPNRLITKLMERENQIGDLSILRSISVTDSVASKQAERAHEMRRVHMSSIGYICPIHTTTGPNIGLNKQIAMFASITPALSSEVIKNILYNDTEYITSLDLLDYNDIAKMNNVFVNGDWVGATQDSMIFLKKYRDIRRRGEISPLITIYWDNLSDEIHFWTDVGRLTRPLVIVYNNKRDPERFSEEDRKKSFIQRTAFTREIMNGLYTGTHNIDTLIKTGLVEYVSAEEQENYLICPSFEDLRLSQHDELLEYTHMDIPQSQLGITALTCIFGQHNNTSKDTFQTSQVKQSCGTFARNWPFRCDKTTFLQYHNEVPLLKTFTNNYVSPAGMNVILSIACYSSYNVEDSLIISKGAIDRGAFNGCRFTFIKTSLEQKEEFGNPDMTRTAGLKHANYNKINQAGMIAIGTILEKGDVVIGKFMHTPKTNDVKIYTDRSIVYNSQEQAIVQNVIIAYNNEDEKICKVYLRKLRPIAIGDKFSNRSGQKGICAMIMRDSDLPCTPDGLRPSFIFNTHGIPTRMTIAQLMETVTGNLYASKGMTGDATFYKRFDMDAVSTELEERGFDPMGRFKMFSGITGEYIDMELFTGIVYYQRLQKFVKDKVYAVSHGPTDAITRQPLNGKSSDGGLRVGEMEKDCLVSHGVSYFLYEKLFLHSNHHYVYICRNCGEYATVNHKKNIYKCIYCRDNADIYKVSSSWSSKLLNHELTAMNVGTRMSLLPYEYEAYMDIKEKIY